MHSGKGLKGSIGIALFCLVAAMMMLLPAGGQIAYADETGGDPAVYFDGTYEGTAQGYGGNMTVAVTISGGKITEIAEVSQKETASYWAKAKTLLETIKEQQTTEVDNIAGATASCDGIKAALNDALAKAAVDPDGWFASGNGSAKSPYIIKTAEQLA